MKNTIKVFGVIALVVMIGFSMAACSNSSNSDGGGGGGGLEGNGVVWDNTLISGVGYVFKGGTLYAATILGDSWAAAKYGTYTGTTIDIPDEGTFTYTISGNTLTLTGLSGSWTKKTGQKINFLN